MKSPKLFVVALTSILLVGASNANAQSAPEFDWKFLGCENDADEFNCALEASTPLVTPCVKAVSELSSKGFRLVATERLFGQTTVQIFQQGFETAFLYCLIQLQK